MPAFSHDAGVLHLRQIDERLDFSRRFAECLSDSRDQRYVIHSRQEQVQQCLFQSALGYPDRNDASFLRHDSLFKVACRLPPFQSPGLSSQPTLSRFENDIDLASILRLLHFFESSYIQALPVDTSSITIDIDSTSSPVYGSQELTPYNAFYRCHMYHPLLLFDAHSNQLITTLLRPGNAHAAKGSLHILCRVIRGIKKRFPLCRILVRADAGFAVPHLYQGLENLNSELGSIESGSVDYEIGIARNAVLLRLTQSIRDQAKQAYEQNYEHIQQFAEVSYAAQTWPSEKRIIVKAEHHHKGENPRFVVVTQKDSTPEALYKNYCGRGQCENGIKDDKNALRGDRLSCSRFVANFFRLLLTAGVYRLMHALRQELKEEQEKLRKKLNKDLKLLIQLAKAQFDTLRQQLLKITAWVKQEGSQLILQFSQAELGAKLLAELLESPRMDTS